MTALDEPYAPYQREAVEAAVAQQETITPLLLQHLEPIASDPQRWLALEDQGPTLLYTLVLLPHFRETRAHPHVVTLATLPKALAEPLLGDAITELLPMALWRTSGGDTTSIQEVAKDRNAYGHGRGAAVAALTEAALLGELDVEATKATLGEWLADDDFAELGDPVWVSLLTNLLSLYATEYVHLLRRRIHEEYIDPWLVPESEIDSTFNRDREAVLAEGRKWAKRHFPEDVHSHLASWASFQPGFWDEPGGDDGSGGGVFVSQDLPPLFGGVEPAGRLSPKLASKDPKKKKQKRKQQKRDRKANRKKRK
ncbi:DUF1186 domain-containing protein [Halorhodospira neutriphila]|nr:DUF1186 domain-containing protein [Halorhodospira neutriphila]